MLQITIPPFELFDELTNEFISIDEPTVLSLEHSLLSLSKWESKWCTPFMVKDEKTPEQTMDYIRCMTLNPTINPMVYLGITEDNINQIEEYIAAPMTATSFSNDGPTGPVSREKVTSELVYYWMISLNIPLECQTWHLNRLITLIKICNIKNAPPKKRSKREIMSRNAALNAARRKQLNTTG